MCIFNVLLFPVPDKTGLVNAMMGFQHKGQNKMVQDKVTFPFINFVNLIVLVGIIDAHCLHIVRSYSSRQLFCAIKCWVLAFCFPVFFKLLAEIHTHNLRSGRQVCAQLMLKCFYCF